MMASIWKRPVSVDSLTEFRRDTAVAHDAGRALRPTGPDAPCELIIRPALPHDAGECVAVRGQTRENAVSEERLRSLGITAQTWAEDIRCGRLPGFVCVDGGSIVGYGFGDSASGEVIVLALLPSHEGRGLGRELLARVVVQLRGLGHRRLFLGCSPDPQVRSHGFYRHLGWSSTGVSDANGDEVLELEPG